ncbi:YbjN domain-containing protein [Ruminococcus sp.]|uniref:YbjN domain-containing protein n=1 Tax=Ruminococcus sp. TaxID=41978 RepID=UPI0039924880
MARKFSLEIANAIENFLSKDDWHYQPCNDNGVIRMGITLNCKFKRADIYIGIDDDAFRILTIFPMTVDEDVRKDMAEFLTRANYNLRPCNFEMDFDDGEIRCRSFHNCADTIPTDQQIQDALYYNVKIVERYGNGIAKIMFGIGTPAEVIKECENS